MHSPWQTGKQKMNPSFSKKAGWCVGGTLFLQCGLTADSHFKDTTPQRPSSNFSSYLIFSNPIFHSVTSSSLRKSDEGPELSLNQDVSTA